MPCFPNHGLADGGAPQSAVTVRHAGKVLHTRAIDLTGSAAAVARELETLADWIAERAAASAAHVVSA